MGLKAYTELLLLHQRGHLFAWVPVFLGAGIGVYFSWPTEPGFSLLLGCASLALLMFWAARQVGAGFAPLFLAVALVMTGMCMSSWRSHHVAAPVLNFRYYGPVEGTVVGIDRSQSDALRVTLADVILSRVSPYKTPARVRVSLHGRQIITPMPGMRVMVTAHLSPPGGPVEPGGFDFQRHAWFKRLGALGYARTPMMMLAPPSHGFSVFAERMRLSRAIQSILAGEVGGFAAAVTTGDRSGISQDTMAALRASNLAHLLAISGLHMGLLAGFVFAALRIGLALIPTAALRLPVKKIAATVALVASAAYLALSGGNVATERAFIMAAVALVAVSLNRRAISMRAVALAAMIVLFMRPESLLGPGFQMSFAATAALVGVFGVLRNFDHWPGPRWLRPVLAVILSSAVAGAATAPFGAAHFNQIAQYGLLANLLAVPLMGLVVIPAAVMAVVLLPLGLEGIALWIMGLGLRWILFVAHWVAEIEGSAGAILRPDPIVLPIMSAGFLFLLLWQGRLRLIGCVPVVAAFVIWSQVQRPEVLISENGGLVGVMTEKGRALSKTKGQGFVARNWLENDGDTVTQPMAADRWNAEDLTLTVRDQEDGKIIHVAGKRALSNFLGCGDKDIVVMSVRYDGVLPCKVFDARSLRTTGSVAITWQDGQAKITTARTYGGRRLWNNWMDQ